MGMTCIHNINPFVWHLENIFSNYTHMFSWIILDVGMTIFRASQINWENISSEYICEDVDRSD